MPEVNQVHKKEFVFIKLFFLQINVNSMWLLWRMPDTCVKIAWECIDDNDNIIFLSKNAFIETRHMTPDWYWFSKSTGTSRVLPETVKRHLIGWESNECQKKHIWCWQFNPHHKGMWLARPLTSVDFEICRSKFCHLYQTPSTKFARSR